MAKKKKSKKKSSRKSKSQKKDKRSLDLQPHTKRQFVAIFMLVLGVVILGSWISDAEGGNVAANTMRFLIGGAIFVAPFVFFYLAIRIFKSTDSGQLPLQTTLGAWLFVFAVSGLAHASIEQEESFKAALDGVGGGMAGYIMGLVTLNIFGAMVGGIILASLVVVALSLLFNISPKELFDKFKIGKKSTKESDAKEEKSAKIKSGFSTPTLNSNVPLIGVSDSQQPKQSRRRSSFKNTAEKIAKEDQQEALTMTADPDWNFPSTSILSDKVEKADAGDWKSNAEIIRSTLEDFKIEVQMGEINVGPRVTQYTLSPPSGVRLNKITVLEQNIALNLAARSIRIEAPIPGKRAVGVEVPNKKSATVRLRNILESSEWAKSKSPLAFTLGQDIAGEPVVAELDTMPHLLIAGQTGAGKSVMINSFLTSLLYRNSPSDLKLILVDPKKVELNLYSDIPHLLTPVITEPEKTISALKWAVEEMERRYSELAEHGKRKIEEYNKMPNEENMPYIVIVIDELSDLMMAAARDVESLIVRIAQKARATGIHLVLATQRPSVDVITGLIKANVPGRIAFTTQSQVDSRTILDGAGAEKLLGMGDMLFMTPTLAKPRRIQGVFVDDKEVNVITDHLKGESDPEYNEDIISQPVQLNGKGGIVADLDGDEDMIEDAVRVVVEAGKASTSLLQRRLRIGYSRAANIMDQLEDKGIISAQDGHRARDVLVSGLDEVFGDDDASSE